MKGKTNMPIKREQPVLFTNSITLEELKEGTNTKAKSISAKVLKDYIDSRLQPTITVGGPSFEEDEENDFDF